MCEVDTAPSPCVRAESTHSHYPLPALATPAWPSPRVLRLYAFVCVCVLVLGAVSFVSAVSHSESPVFLQAGLP